MADDGIEFILELNAKLDEALGMIKELKNVESAVNRADVAFKKTEHEIGFFGHAMEKATDWIKDFGKEALATFTGLASFEGVKALGEMIVDIGKEGLIAAGNAEQVGLAFETLLGKEPGSELEEYLERVAKKTEFTGAKMKEFGLELVRAGIKGNELHKALAGAVDIAATALPGQHESTATGALDLIERIKLKGGISAKELTRAGIDVHPFFKSLAGDLGTGVKDVEKRLREGTIKSSLLMDEFYAAIQKKTGKPVGMAGEAMSETFIARLGKIKEIIPSYFETLAKSPGLKNLSGALGRVLEALDPSGPTGKKIIAGLESLFNKVGGFIGSVDIGAVIERVSSAFAFWRDTLGPVVSLLSPLFSILGSVLSIVFDLGKVLIETLNPALSFLASLAQTILEGWSLIGDVLSKLVSFLVPYMSDLGKNMVGGLINGVLGETGALIDSFVNLGKSAIGALKGVLGIHSPSRVFAQLGEHTAAGFSVGLDAGGPRVEKTAGDVFSPESLYSPSPGAASAASSARGGGGMTVNADIEINVSAGAGGSARETAEVTAVSVRQALQSVMEQFRAEVGA